MIKELPSQERLKELFDYREGQLFRKIDTAKNCKKGTIAGGLNKGQRYYRVKIDKTQYQLHRVIYKWHFGNFNEDFFIDHINQNTLDNRVENLRLVTVRENAFNLKNVRGCSFNKKTGKYRSGIRVDGKTKMLGCYTTLEEAKNAYLKAKNVFHTIEDRRL